ncbi:hypothetical protein BGZ97_006446 [Linnemannia gamsii]|uniref:Uncharacterized protein n=1 Tax=Linnemannia gamsii TaxID=64522 RepID=A0A9P6QRT4_9FUNG|nr:hypothetical protein BGZ97_006446 [Linnemannia gamsii]
MKAYRLRGMQMMRGATVAARLKPNGLSSNYENVLRNASWSCILRKPGWCTAKIVEESVG